MRDGVILTLEEAQAIFNEDVKHILPIHLISFGWTPVLGGSRSLPKANVYLDCRGLPNPHHTTLSARGGDDPLVINWVRTSTSAQYRFVEEIEEAISRLPVRRRAKENPYEDPLVVALGCAWGVHRSVAMKHILHELLRQRGWVFTEVK